MPSLEEIREFLNTRQRLVSIVTLVVIVVAIWVAVAASRPGTHVVPNRTPKLYFSDDDGKTWFLDDADKIPPYTDDAGKTAYRVALYRCANGKVFVGRLEGFDPAVKRKLEEAAKAVNGDANLPFMGGLNVKRPGDAQWVSTKAGPGSGQLSAAMSPVCPDGSGADVRPVTSEEDVKPPG